MARKQCTIQDCDRFSIAREMCQKHYGRFYRGGDPNVARVKSSNKSCSVVIDGQPCQRKYAAKGYCANHYEQNKLWGDPLGKRPEASSGKRKYKYIAKPGHPNSVQNGTIAEHRWVMSEHLGRPLLVTENVHHKNGNTFDNRLSNLELWSIAQPSGQRIEDKVEWALELLQTYAPEKLR